MTNKTPEIDLSQISEQSTDFIKTIDEAYNIFRKHGWLVIRNAYNKNYIESIATDYNKQFSNYFLDQEYGDALRVGDKRTMITVPLSGAFNDPDFYANSKLMPIFKKILGKHFIVNSLGSVISLPGAKDQNIHRDHPHLFIPSNSNTPEWSKELPTSALTVAIPLIALNKETGNTRFWSETHIKNTSEIDPNLGKGEDFCCDIGTCILFDYNVLHSGVANNSQHVRPLLYNVYSRPWFRDAYNYDHATQDPLVISEEDFDLIPEKYKKMFSWALSAKSIKKIESSKRGDIGRNDPCYCNSGKKYKHCHGQI